MCSYNLFYSRIVLIVFLISLTELNAGNSGRIDNWSIIISRTVFAYEKVEIFIKISSLKEADNILKNIISGQNGVFVIFNKRRNRIGKPLMRGNFENTHPSIIKRHLSYLDWYFEFYPLRSF